MSFDFPNGPTEGQVFEAVPGGVAYIYTSGKWMMRTDPSAVYVTDAPIDGVAYARKDAIWESASPHFMAGASQLDGTTDWNTIPAKGGWFPKLLGSGNANAPAAGYFYCLTLNYAGNFTQEAHPYSHTTSQESGFWYRGWHASTLWAPWRQVGGKTLISDTAPAAPQPGQLWWNSANGNLYIWYMDGTSNQWVQINSVGT